MYKNNLIFRAFEQEITIDRYDIGICKLLFSFNT